MLGHCINDILLDTVALLSPVLFRHFGGVNTLL